MNIIAIILLILTILIIIVPTIVCICTGEWCHMTISMISLITFMLFSFAQWPSPTTEDVRDGKAIYVEDYNIGINSQGDTIYNYKTYKLQWLPEWKYGRKH